MLSLIREHFFFASKDQNLENKAGYLKELLQNNTQEAYNNYR